MKLDADQPPTGEWADSGEGVALGEWECMECGYIEAGVKSKRPRECPDCGAPSLALEFFPYEEDDAEDAATDGDASPYDDMYEDEDEKQG